MTKTKHRKPLEAETNLAFQMSPIIPNFKLMCSSQKPHRTHWEITKVIYTVLLTDW